MAKEPVMGAEVLRESEEYEKSQRVQRIVEEAKAKAQKAREKIQARKERHEQEILEHPYKTGVKDAMRYQGMYYGAMGVRGGTLFAGAAALPAVALVNHKLNKNFKNEFGMGFMQYGVHNAIGYGKAMKSSVFATETDKDYALQERRYSNYSGIKFQKHSENARTTILSWFGMDEEADQLNQRDEKFREQEYEHAKRLEEMEKRAKEEMKRRHAMMLPNAVSAYFMNPMVARYWAAKMEQPSKLRPDEHNEAEKFFDAESAPESVYEGSVEDERFHGSERHRTSEDDYIPGEYKDVTPREPNMYNGYPALPVGDSDDYSMANMDSEVLDTYISMQKEFCENTPAYEVALMNSRKKWKGVSNEAMVEQMQQLQSGAYMNYMMAGIANGDIVTVDDLNAHREMFDKQWAEFENDKLMPMYGDRIRAYMAEKNHTPNKADNVLISANERKIAEMRAGKVKALAIEDAKKSAAKGLEENAKDFIQTSEVVMTEEESVRLLTDVANCSEWKDRREQYSNRMFNMSLSPSEVKSASNSYRCHLSADNSVFMVGTILSDEQNHYDNEHYYKLCEIMAQQAGLNASNKEHDYLMNINKDYASKYTECLTKVKNCLGEDKYNKIFNKYRKADIESEYLRTHGDFTAICVQRDKEDRQYQRGLYAQNEVSEETAKGLEENANKAVSELDVQSVVSRNSQARDFSDNTLLNAAANFAAAYVGTKIAAKQQQAQREAEQKAIEQKNGDVIALEDKSSVKQNENKDNEAEKMPNENPAPVISSNEHSKSRRALPSNIASIEAEAKKLDSAENYLTAVRNRHNMEELPNQGGSEDGMQYE